MPEEPATTFAALFEQLRLAKHWSPAETARQLGVSYSMVSRWRRGENVPTLQAIETISTVFGFDRETLEQLAGYRANTIASEHDTVDPLVSAMYDVTVNDIRERLKPYPKPFWEVIMKVLTASVDLAIENAEAWQQIGISKDAQGELDDRSAKASKNEHGTTRGRNGRLTTPLLASAAY